MLYNPIWAPARQVQVCQALALWVASAQLIVEQPEDLAGRAVAAEPVAPVS